MNIARVQSSIFWALTLVWQILRPSLDANASVKALIKLYKSIKAFISFLLNQSGKWIHGTQSNYLEVSSILTRATDREIAEAETNFLAVNIYLNNDLFFDNCNIWLNQGYLIFFLINFGYYFSFFDEAHGSQQRCWFWWSVWSFLGGFGYIVGPFSFSLYKSSQRPWFTAATITEIEFFEAKP